MAGSGGAWKVAYADFVTAMMAFFLVMWLVGQGQDVKEAVAGYFQDPWGTSSDLSAPASLIPTEEHGKAPVLDLPKRGKGGAGEADEPNDNAESKSKWSQKRKVHFLQDGDRSTPAIVVSFDESSAELSDRAKDELDRLIPTLLGKVNMVEVRGHSTRRPLPESSPYRDLWELCYARCQAVTEYLESHGIEPERIRLSQSNAFEPISRQIEMAWQNENSRVEVFLLNELANELPGTSKALKSDPTDRATPEDGH